MRNAARPEYGVSGLCADLSVADLEQVFAGEDVPPFILIVVNMERYAS
jgi:hypothetical protein